MTPEQLRLEETHSWLARARNDLKAAKLLVAGKAYAEALFHCQQAVEKALKAFLLFHEIPFGRTHDLSELGPECVALDGSLRSTVDKVSHLTSYAWRFRDPGAPYEPEESEAADALQKAEAALGEVEQRLP